jgi:hypothetical protein
MTDATAEPTAKTAPTTLTFEMCPHGPYGHFLRPEHKGKSPAIFSLKNGKVILDRLEKRGEISLEEKTQHLSDMAAKGIPEDNPSDEQIREYLDQAEGIADSKTSA